ncbi:hypothetical protein QIS74_08079 [Colletotrichum tabaci]|uniref:Uncharacterized protein n=1 Tax=Colletotrichum tabaci TaxID=1209068 RepID=A0AAV9T6V3_9PEZI
MPEHRLAGQPPRATHAIVRRVIETIGRTTNVEALIGFQGRSPMP